MGIFSDHVRRYFEFGLTTIPCRDKRPVLGRNWERWCDEPITAANVDDWERRFPDVNQIGLPAGKSTGLVHFDFDYKFDERKCTISEAEFRKDLKVIERSILALLPASQSGKVGGKGWTKIFKLHGDMSNVQCDRHGLRLFDFLAKHKQTIIPPSFYSDDKTYRWLGDPIEEVYKDLPVITMDIIEEIRLVCGSTSGFDFTASGRHGLLFKWLLDCVRIEPDNRKLAGKLWERDKRTNIASPYLTDPKHFSSRDPEVNAVKWIERVRKFVGEVKVGAVSSYGWDYFFENSFSECRKDIISKKVFFRKSVGSEWELMDGVEGVLRSYAGSRGLFPARTVDELERWSFEKSDCDFLCDLPVWDGVDRVGAFGRSVHSDVFTGDEVADIFRHWGAGIFRRVRSADIQNRCVILKGPQGIGKDYLVRAMLRDFKPYYESTTMPGTQKDALEIVARLLVVHIEEFDQTKNMDVAFLKSLITQPSAFFRESYGAAPSQRVTRPSFISTANVDDILRDPTGNRRFIVVPVTKVDWTYPLDQSIQVLAQWRAYCERGEWTGLSVELEEKIKAIVDDFTPDDLSVSIMQMYRVIFRQKIVGNVIGHLGGEEMIGALSEIAKAMQCGIRKVQSTMKGAGVCHRTSSGIRYFASKDDCERYRAGNEKSKKMDKKTAADVAL